MQGEVADGSHGQVQVWARGPGCSVKGSPWSVWPCPAPPPREPCAGHLVLGQVLEPPEACPWVPRPRSRVSCLLVGPGSRVGQKGVRGLKVRAEAGGFGRRSWRKWSGLSPGGQALGCSSGLSHSEVSGRSWPAWGLAPPPGAAAEPQASPGWPPSVCGVPGSTARVLPGSVGLSVAHPASPWSGALGQRPRPPPW